MSTDLALPPLLRDRGIDVARAWRIPMTTRFRRITVREGVLLHGPAGWSEFSPFADYDPVESSAWLAAALEDATGQRPPRERSAVPVNATVPVVPPDAAQQIVHASGARTAKVKVADPGTPLAADLDRVAAVRDVLGPAGRIRVDANGAWSLAEAELALPALDRAAGGLEYAEQPVASLEDLAALRRQVSVPLAADELVRRAEDPLRVARAHAADLLVLKVQPLGGIRRCLELAEEAGLPVVVSSALESGIGLSAGVALAAALPELQHDCGLGTGALLTGDLVDPPFLPEEGLLPVERPEPDEGSLRAHAADPDTTRRWQQRLADCAEVLRPILGR